MIVYRPIIAPGTRFGSFWVLLLGLSRNCGLRIRSIASQTLSRLNGRKVHRYQPQGTSPAQSSTITIDFGGSPGMVKETEGWIMAAQGRAARRVWHHVLQIIITPAHCIHQFPHIGIDVRIDLRRRLVNREVMGPRCQETAHVLAAWAYLPHQAQRASSLLCLAVLFREGFNPPGCFVFTFLLNSIRNTRIKN